jgi:hypothetical protein
MVVDKFYAVSEQKANIIPCMTLRTKLTPIQVLERLQLRLEQRMETLQRVKMECYDLIVSELETELDLLRRAQRYLED